MKKFSKKIAGLFLSQKMLSSATRNMVTDKISIFMNVTILQI